MILFTVRPYLVSDLGELVKVYQSAFAEPPWNESWTYEDIEKDLEYARAQDSPIILVAESNSALIGFTWGYKIPFEKFPFLNGKIPVETNYMDEIAVSGNNRIKGVGYKLCIEYMGILKKDKYLGIVLRTDQRNNASMALFRKARLKSLDIYDPEFPDRLYLYKNIGGTND